MLKDLDCSGGRHAERPRMFGWKANRKTETVRVEGRQQDLACSGGRQAGLN